MEMTSDTAIVSPSKLADVARPVRGEDADYAELLDELRNKRLVLIGEATHGTHEFYDQRARITRRLIDECGFNAVAAEADWPDAYRVNRYVNARSDDAHADEALSDFRRFPSWMWRNRVVVEFVEWLRARNDAVDEPSRKAGFYGLDLYSLRASIEAVIGYLDSVDPAEAERARERYACFDHIGGDGQRYGLGLAFEQKPPCEDEVVEQLVELRRRADVYLRRDGWVAEDEQFFAEQNAQVVRNAEEYYQQMYRGQVSSWNLRDRHMAGTLEALLQHLSHQLGDARIVVWEHNSHVGDARRTEMGARGELNVGQLVRERHGDDCHLVGFTTNDGEVTAASDWGGAAERKTVRPARDDSHEAMLHDVPVPSFWLPADDRIAASALASSRLERAIGVIYRPETERRSHYFHAELARQFDTLIHIDRTSALEPLERTQPWDEGEPPEAYPFGQ